MVSPAPSEPCSLCGMLGHYSSSKPTVAILDQRVRTPYRKAPDRFQNHGRGARFLSPRQSAVSVRIRLSLASLACFTRCLLVWMTTFNGDGEQVTQTRLVNERALYSMEKWDGSRGAWKRWSFVMKAYVSRASPQLLRAMDGLALATTPVNNSQLAADAQELNGQFYYCLTSTLTGAALDELMNIEPGNGLEYWRRT